MPTITISGVTSAALAKYQLEMTFPWPKQSFAFRETLKLCRDLRGEYPCVEFMCPCGNRLVLRLARDAKQTPIAMASWPGTAHRPKETGCRCGCEAPLASLLDLKDVMNIEQAFQVMTDECLKTLNLRLEPAQKRIGKGLESVASEGTNSNPAAREKRFTKTLLGLLNLFCEYSQLCAWRPERGYATRADLVLEWMRNQVWSNESLAAKFEHKTVFDGVAPDLQAALATACESDETNLRNLKNRALLISISSKSEGIENARFIHLTSDSKETRLLLSDSIARLFKTRKKRRLLAYTRSNPNALVLLIAAVRPDGTDFLIEFAACSLIDRFGVIYESEWEFMAGAQLQEANCPFAKPASTLYWVARGRRRPDFIVFDSTGRQFIVEVDPPANRLTKARKDLRDVEYNAEGICCVRWNPLKNPSLIALLLVEGFVL